MIHCLYVFFSSANANNISLLKPTLPTSLPRGTTDVVVRLVAEAVAVVIVVESVVGVVNSAYVFVVVDVLIV